MSDAHVEGSAYQPLAARVRPRTLEEFRGQAHILGQGMPLREALEAGQIHSMVLWGPPGVGKTTLARLIARCVDAQFETLSAVLSGVKEIRQAIDMARGQRSEGGRKTILFIDEVHRFNKAQQDAFLPHVEDGTLVFIGATTENPSFELNNALLSRCRVYVMKPLQQADLVAILRSALGDERGALSERVTAMAPELLEQMAQAADGDARRALNLLEIAVDLGRQDDGSVELTGALAEQLFSSEWRRFDKGGDSFYDQISALHKAVRGSSPDAALYWLVRMLDGGCDPLYIARRLVRMASEDIGNADPRALGLALHAWDAQLRLGSPEGELALAQAVVYLAAAPKSNAVYRAFKAAWDDVRKRPAYEVPLHLRNAATALMKQMQHGADYRYAHDEDGGYAAGECYLPEALAGQRYYHPVARGLEKRIAEKLDYLRARDEQSARRRYGD